MIQMNSIEEAELVKVWENSIRNISIAESNLLAMLCDSYGFSIDRILKGLRSKTKQFKIDIAYPGIGPGGHCIPEDIQYLIKKSENDTNVNVKLLKDSVKINENMPQYLYNKLINKIVKNKENIFEMKVLMLGKSYKSNSKDTRRSPALSLLNIIKKNCKNVKIVDPLVDNELSNFSREEKSNIEEMLKEVDILILSCPHDIFLNIDFEEYKNIKYVVDCWNRLDYKKIKRNGINYIGVGIN